MLVNDGTNPGLGRILGNNAVRLSMCLAVYIASDADLPLIPWDDQNPEFNVVPIPGGEELVRRNSQRATWLT